MTRRLMLPAALLSAGAGAIHLGAAVPHFGDDLLLGVGFAVMGWLQLVLAALLLLRPTRPLLLGGIAIHLAALAALVVSRTVGLPIGHPGVEPVGLPDALTALLEAASVLLLAVRAKIGTVVLLRPAAATATLGAAALLVLGGSTAAIADLGTGGHHADTTEDSAHAHADTDTDAGGDHHAAEDDAHHADDATDEQPGTPALTEAIHPHDDGSVHIHAAGSLHDHTDGSVHIHAQDATDDHHGDAGGQQDTSADHHDDAGAPPHEH